MKFCPLELEIQFFQSNLKCFPHSTLSILILNLFLHIIHKDVHKCLTSVLITEGGGIKSVFLFATNITPILSSYPFSKIFIVYIYIFLHELLKVFGEEFLCVTHTHKSIYGERGGGERETEREWVGSLCLCYCERREHKGTCVQVCKCQKQYWLSS